jgi:hypothetical protein
MDKLKEAVTVSTAASKSAYVKGSEWKRLKNTHGK